MTVRYILAGLELALMILFLIALPVVNLGNIAGVGISVILLAVTLGFPKFSQLVRKLWAGAGGKVFILAVCLVILICAGFAVFCTVKMLGAVSKEQEKPSAVVVLGCQVRGERPSKMLRRRLDAAIGYLNDNPDIPVIVSGGQGWDDATSEALCMKNYLTEQGISDDRIIMEDKSTSTDENLQFSFDILDEMGLSRDIVLVTDGYHQYRAQLIADKHGAGDVSSVSAPTEFRFIPTYWVREWFGIFQQLFLK